MSTGVLPTTGNRSIALEAHGRTVRMEFSNPGDHIAKKLLRGEWYERDLLEDARKRLRQGVVVDVGAHVGNHTLWFGGICGSRVVSLEPNPESFRQLENNVKLNGLDSWLLPAAAGKEESIGEVVPLNDNNSGMTRVDVGSGDIPVLTIDGLNLRDVALMKIDVEDSELDVLWGARQTLRREHPVLYVEARLEAAQARLKEFLKPFDYRLIGVFGWTATWGFV